MRGEIEIRSVRSSLLHTTPSFELSPFKRGPLLLRFDTKVILIQEINHNLHREHCRLSYDE